MCSIVLWLWCALALLRLIGWMNHTNLELRNKSGYISSIVYIYFFSAGAMEYSVRFHHFNNTLYFMSCLCYFGHLRQQTEKDNRNRNERDVIVFNTFSRRRFQTAANKTHCALNTRIENLRKARAKSRCSLILFSSEECSFIFVAFFPFFLVCLFQLLLFFI